MGNEKAIEYLKAKIKKKLEAVAEQMGKYRYKLYLAMVDDCNDIDELCEMAELDLQMELFDYTKSEIEPKLNALNMTLADIRRLDIGEYPVLRRSLEKHDLEPSEIQDLMNDEEVTVAMATLLYERLQNTPPEELDDGIPDPREFIKKMDNLTEEDYTEAFGDEDDPEGQLYETEYEAEEDELESEIQELEDSENLDAADSWESDTYEEDDDSEDSEDTEENESFDISQESIDELFVDDDNGEDEEDDSESDDADKEQQIAELFDDSLDGYEEDTSSYFESMYDDSDSEDSDDGTSEDDEESEDEEIDEYFGGGDSEDEQGGLFDDEESDDELNEYFGGLNDSEADSIGEPDDSELDDYFEDEDDDSSEDENYLEDDLDDFFSDVDVGEEEEDDTYETEESEEDDLDDFFEDEDQGDLDESETSEDGDDYFSEDAELDDFFGNSDDDTVKETVHQPAKPQKPPVRRGDSPKTVFLDGTKRGQKSQNMFNVFNRLYNKTSSAAAKSKEKLSMNKEKLKKLLDGIDDSEIDI